MAPRLKVYATRIGFHDVVVAAPNQKAALAAWDVRDNLFAEGAAKETDDPSARKAALDRPGVVLSRAIGEAGAFQVEASVPARPPKAAGKPAKRAVAGKAKPSPARKPRPDRAPLTAAEKAVSKLDADVRRTRDRYARERRDLDAREAADIRRLDSRRRELERERDRLQRVYTRDMGE